MMYEVIKTEEELISYLTRNKGFLYGDPLTSFDTETTGLTIEATLLGISLFNYNRNPAYISIKNRWFDGIERSKAIELLEETFGSMRGLAHNGKFDLLVFKQNGFAEITLEVDSSLAVHAYDPELLKKLETRVKLDLGYSKQTFEEIIGKKWSKINWDIDTKPSIDKKTGANVPPLITLDLMAEYACEDVYWTMKLWEFYEPKIKEYELSDTLYKIEVPLSYTLRDMKYRGVSIDVPVLEEIGTRIDTKLDILEEEIYDLAGCQFNINSSQQKAEVLFNRLGLPQKYLTKGGKPSTDANALSELASDGHPIAGVMVEHSKLKTLNTNFVRAIPTLIDFDGKLRCDFNSDGARTGRMSSNGPNLQNQPNNEEYPVRKAFVPTKGFKFGIADWSQIELRIMAHCSKDPKLMKAFWDDEDIHTRVSIDLGIPRKGAKVINFGILYGMGPQKLAKTLGISEADARSIINGYFSTYTGFKHWKEYVEGFVTRKGYVRNIFKRIRRLPDATQFRDKRLYSAALRQAVNTIIQGSAADLMKLGMLSMNKMFIEEQLEAYLLLVVHDEFVNEIRDDGMLEYTFSKIVDVMENSIKLRVPIKADGKICDNWSDMKNDDYISIHHRRTDIFQLLNYTV